MYKLIESNIERWEIENSSLYKINSQANYYECRKYSCDDISKKTMYQAVPMTKNFTIEVPYFQDFHIIGRVNTNSDGDFSNFYYKSFEERDYISFSTINKNNISRYKGKRFFAYNILPGDIVHVFPLDSDIKTMAECEYELSSYPSIWLTLEELEKLSYEMGVYNQVTCKTKRIGEIIKPFAVVCFDKVTSEDKEVAEEFGIGKILVHPDQDCISYGKDLYYDVSKAYSVDSTMQKKYGLSLKHSIYLD